MDEKRLEAFEKMLRAIQEEYADIIKKMDELKQAGRAKSVTHQQLMARKLMCQNMLSMYGIYGLIEE